jgi:hypothetical protein
MNLDLEHWIGPQRALPPLSKWNGCIDVAAKTRPHGKHWALRGAGHRRPAPNLDRNAELIL